MDNIHTHSAKRKQYLLKVFDSLQFRFLYVIH